MENPTISIATQLLKQISETSPKSSNWLFSSINRFLQVNPDMKLSEFYELLKETNKNNFDVFKEVYESKGRTIL